MMNKHILIYSLNALFTFLLLNYLFYRRFLIMHLSKELSFFDGSNIKLSLMFFVFLSFIFCFIKIIHIIFLMRKRQSHNIFSQMTSRINMFLDNAFFDLYNFICNLIPKIYHKVAFLCQKFYAIFQNFS